MRIGDALREVSGGTCAGPTPEERAIAAADAFDRGFYGAAQVGEYDPAQPGSESGAIFFDFDQTLSRVDSVQYMH